MQNLPHDLFKYEIFKFLKPTCESKYEEKGKNCRLGIYKWKNSTLDCKEHCMHHCHEWLHDALENIPIYATVLTHQGLKKIPIRIEIHFQVHGNDISSLLSLDTPFPILKYFSNDGGKHYRRMNFRNDNIPNLITSEQLSRIVCDVLHSNTVEDNVYSSLHSPSVVAISLDKYFGNYLSQDDHFRGFAYANVDTSDVNQWLGKNSWWIPCEHIVNAIELKMFNYM